MLPSAQGSLSRIPAKSLHLRSPHLRFPASHLGSGRRSRVRGLSYFPPVTSHESPVTAVVWGILSPLATSPVNSLECAVTKKVGRRGGTPEKQFHWAACWRLEELRISWRKMVGILS